MGRYQKGKTNLDFSEARDNEWQRHQLRHMQVCTSLQTDNHASTPPLSFLTGRMPFLPPNQQCRSTEGKQQQHTPVQKAPIVAELERKSQGRGQSTKRFIEENYHKNSALSLQYLTKHVWPAHLLECVTALIIIIIITTTTIHAK